jgi:hypothetical protein
MRKDYRQNYRAGTNPFGKKSNLQKIAETFGPKKKVKKNKKPTKRMFANKGGRAALRMGTKNSFNKEEKELQKKVDRDALIFGAKKAIERAKGKDKLKKVLDTKTNETIFKKISEIQKDMDRFKPVGGSPFINAVQKIMREREPGNTRFSNTDIQLAKDALKRGIKPSEMKKGGLAKKKKKFPDMSGDGKVTMKDVLMARGVIPKKKKTKKKVI